jgi:hypothetical protein
MTPGSGLNETEPTGLHNSCVKRSRRCLPVSQTSIPAAPRINAAQLA